MSSGSKGKSSLYFPGGRGYSAGGFSVLRYPVGDASDTGDRRIPDKEKGDSAGEEEEEKDDEAVWRYDDFAVRSASRRVFDGKCSGRVYPGSGETLRGRGGTGGRVKAYPESDADQYTR